MGNQESNFTSAADESEASNRMEKQSDKEAKISNFPWLRVATLVRKLEVSSDVKKPSTSSIFDGIEQEFEQIKYLIERENIADVDVINAIDEVEDSLSLKATPDFILINALKTLLQALRPIDCPILFERLRATYFAREHIEGKDIVLLIGESGAGKSTLVHFLSGAKMNRTLVDGLNHIQPVDLPLRDLTKFVSSPHARSETRFLNAIEVPVQINEIEKIWLADTPGFGDTEGIEVDIANGISTVEAIRCCRSVRLVVMVSQANVGDRGEGIIRLFHTLVKLINRPEDHIAAITFVFTKYPKTETGHVENFIREVFKNLKAPDNTNSSLVALFHKLLRSDIIIVDPVNDSPRQLWELLTLSYPINNPSSVFRNFVTKDSLAKLKAYLQRLEVSIKALLEGVVKNISDLGEALSDVESVQHYFKELEDFDSTLNLRESKHSLSTSQYCFQSAMEEIDVRWRALLLTLRDSNEGDAVFKTVLALPHTALVLARLDDANNHTLVQQICSTQSDLLERLKCILEGEGVGSGIESESSCGGHQLKKMVALTSVFNGSILPPDCSSATQGALKWIEANVVEFLVRSVQEGETLIIDFSRQSSCTLHDALGDLDWLSALSSLNKLHYAIELTADMSGERSTFVRDLYEAAKSQIEDQFGAAHNSAWERFEPTGTTASDGGVAVHCFAATIESLLNERVIECHKHGLTEVLSSLRLSIIDRVKCFIQSSCCRLKAIIVSPECPDVIECVAQDLNLIEKFRNGSMVAAETTNQYWEFLRIIRNIVENLGAEALDNIRSMTVDKVAFSRAVLSLHSAHRLLGRNEQCLYNNEFQAVCQALQQIVFETSCQVRDAVICASNHRDVKSLLLKCDFLAVCESIFSKLSCADKLSFEMVDHPQPTSASDFILVSREPFSPEGNFEFVAKTDIGGQDADEGNVEKGNIEEGNAGFASTGELNEKKRKRQEPKAVSVTDADVEKICVSGDMTAERSVSNTTFENLIVHIPVVMSKREASHKEFPPSQLLFEQHIDCSPPDGVFVAVRSTLAEFTAKVARQLLMIGDLFSSRLSCDVIALGAFDSSQLQYIASFLEVFEDRLGDQVHHLRGMFSSIEGLYFDSIASHLDTLLKAIMDRQSSWSSLRVGIGSHDVVGIDENVGAIRRILDHLIELAAFGTQHDINKMLVSFFQSSPSKALDIAMMRLISPLLTHLAQAQNDSELAESWALAQYCSKWLDGALLERFHFSHVSRALDDGMRSQRESSEMLAQHAIAHKSWRQLLELVSKMDVSLPHVASNHRRLISQACVDVDTVAESLYAQLVTRPVKILGCGMPGSVADRLDSICDFTETILPIATPAFIRKFQEHHARVRREVVTFIYNSAFQRYEELLMLDQFNVSENLITGVVDLIAQLIDLRRLEMAEKLPKLATINEHALAKCHGRLQRLLKCCEQETQSAINNIHRACTGRDENICHCVRELVDLFQNWAGLMKQLKSCGTESVCTGPKRRDAYGTTSQKLERIFEKTLASFLQSCFCPDVESYQQMLIVLGIQQPMHPRRDQQQRAVEWDSEIQHILLASLRQMNSFDIIASNKFDGLIDMCESICAERSQAVEREAAAVARSGDWKSLLSSYEAALKHKYLANWEVSHRHIQVFFEKQIDSLNNIVAQRNMRSWWEMLAQCWDEWQSYLVISLSGTRTPMHYGKQRKLSFQQRDAKINQRWEGLFQSVVQTYSTMLVGLENNPMKNVCKEFGERFVAIECFLRGVNVLRQSSSDLQRSGPPTLSKALQSNAWINKIGLRLQVVVETVSQYLSKNCQSALEALERLRDPMFGASTVQSQQRELQLLRQWLDASKDTQRLLCDLQPFQQNFENIKSYDSLQMNLCEVFNEWLTFLDQKIMNQHLSPNGADRDDFFNKYSSIHGLVCRCGILFVDHIPAAMDGTLLTRQSSLSDILCGQLAEVKGALMEMASAWPEESASSYARASIFYDIFRSVNASIENEALQRTALTFAQDVEQKYQAKLRDIFRPAEDEVSYAPDDMEFDIVINILVDVKFITLHFSQSRILINKLIDKLLHRCRQSNSGSKKIGSLGVMLNNLKMDIGDEREGVAQMVIAEHAEFEGYAISLRNTRTLRFTAAMVLAGLIGDQVDKVTLQSAYDAFDAAYWKRVSDGIASGDVNGACDAIVKETLGVAKKDRLTFKVKISTFLVNLFSFWTLSNAQTFLEAEDLDDGLNRRKTFSVQSLLKTADQVLSARSNHEVMGTSDYPSRRELKAAHHDLCLKFHSDKIPQDANEIERETFVSAFRRVQGAYEMMLPACPVQDTSVNDSQNGLSEEMERRNYLLQPHSAQVISILRFFEGVEGSSQGSAPSFTKQFIEIGTGEGKSVTLAITAAVIALLGIEVDCACYSEYLCRRDHRSFSDLFAAFGISDFIKYDTFNHLAEEFLNRGFANGGMRGAVCAMVEAQAVKDRSLLGAFGHLMSDAALTLKDAAQNGLEAAQLLIGLHARPRQRVLLVDEVDVFFSEQFMGGLYAPVAKLRHPTISALVRFIFTVRNNPATLTLGTLSACGQFKACVAAFPDWEELVTNSLKRMIVDIKKFEKHEYEVMRGRIAYKDHDGMVFNKQIGYQTTFAYLKARAELLIEEAVVEEEVGLIINCGCHSYAEIPIMYNSVLGVSGTLRTLSPMELDLLKRKFQITKFTYTPSIYGNSQLEFGCDSARDVQIHPSKEPWMIAIVNEIKQRLQGTSMASSSPRAVLVFFESMASLNAFYKSATVLRSSLKDVMKVVSEKTSLVDKEASIRLAVTAGCITLLTKALGRGTDFKCYDEKLDASGGVHVIQTFVSEHLSEDTQIRGRTARQGNKGSYSMVLCLEDLEKFSINAAVVQTMQQTSSIYSTIKDLRMRAFEKKFPEATKFMNEIESDHVKAQEFLQNLQERNGDRAFIDEQNKFAYAEAVASRTICLMDATGSMSSLLQKSKNAVHEMFKRAHRVLADNSVDEGAFELQFAVYRNYNCDENTILEHSTWERHPLNLHHFMESVSPRGGLGNEALEIGFAHVNEELTHGNVTQVIVIGDMPPNTRDEVKTKRAKYGWTGRERRFAVPTHFERELQSMIAKGVVVHCFYVHENAAYAFEAIAAQASGKCCRLDIDSARGADMLTHLVTEQILLNVGGADNGEALVNSYRSLYATGYTSEK